MVDDIVIPKKSEGLTVINKINANNANVFVGKLGDLLYKAVDKPLVMDGGVYGCTQGPRLETTAEVNRYKIEGCDLLGMTAMPEAVLARELGIDYALLALSANWAAGQFEGEILMGDISKVVEQSTEFLIGMLQILVEKYNNP